MKNSLMLKEQECPGRFEQLGWRTRLFRGNEVRLPKDLGGCQVLPWAVISITDMRFGDRGILSKHR
jgi:hypothetical protein